jgi:hypothetical protein
LTEFRNLAPGDEGEAVRDLQHRLGSLEKRLVGARSKGQLMAELAQFIGG